MPHTISLQSMNKGTLLQWVKMGKLFLVLLTAKISCNRCFINNVIYSSIEQQARTNLTNISEKNQNKFNPKLAGDSET